MLVAVWMSRVSASPPSPYYWSCIAAYISLQEDLITLCLQASSSLRWGKGCEHLSLLKKIEVNPTVIRPGKVGLKCVIFKRWPAYKRRWCPHCKSMINRYLKQLEREKSWLQNSSRAVLSMAGHFKLAYANMNRWELSEMVNRASLVKWQQMLVLLSHWNKE